MKNNPVQITKEQVEKIAGISRLKLTDNEIDKLQTELSGTIDYIKILSGFDTKNVIPTFQTNNQLNVSREDKAEKGLTKEQALAGSKSTYQGFFKTSPLFK